MKNILFILFFYQFVSIGQNNQLQDIKWEIIPNRKLGSAPELIGSVDDAFYVVKHDKKDYFLYQYSTNDVTLKKTLQLDLEYNGEKLYYNYAFKFNDLIVLISGKYNKKEKLKYYYYHILNPANLTLSASKLLGYKTSRNYITYSEASLDDELMEGVFFAQSPNNKNYVSFFVEYDRKNKDNKSNFKGFFFEENLKNPTPFSFKVTYPFYDIDNFELSNNRKLYYIVIQKKSKKYNKKYNIEKVYLSCFDGEDNLSVDLDFDGFQMSDINLKILDNNKVMVMGLYGTDVSIEGVFSFIFSEDLKLENYEFNKFEKDFEASNKNIHKKGKYYYFEIRNIIPLSNNTTTMLVEMYNEYEKYYNVNGETKSKTYYIYKDILAFNFDDLGNVNWKARIGKYQISSNDYGFYSSFYVEKDKNDNLNFIFSEKRNIYRARITPSGETKKELVYTFPESDKRTRMISTYTRKIDDENVMVITRNFKKEIKIGKIKL